MMKNCLLALSVFCIFLIGSDCSYAKEGGDHICFRRMDTNQDGKVTFKEFAVHFGKDETKFSTADKDGNGLLTHDEYHDYLGHGHSGKSKTQE